MTGDLVTVILIAGAAASASLGGGLISLWYRPTPFGMSLTFGFAGGILLGAVGLDMLPRAVELAGFFVAAAGFAVGFGAIYGLDLLVHRGRLAGGESEMHEEVARFHRHQRPRGGEGTVLAAGTTIEELVEGLAIGVGAVIDLRLALVIALATAIDNISEALNIGQLYQNERARAGVSTTWLILGWTALIGINDLIGATLGWFLLRDAVSPLLSFIFAVGGGGMFYIAITDLVPISQERQYQQSAGLATALGFLIALAI
jgi:ZIP family zinc transporter